MNAFHGSCFYKLQHETERKHQKDKEKKERQERRNKQNQCLLVLASLTKNGGSNLICGTEEVRECECKCREVQYMYVMPILHCNTQLEKERGKTGAFSLLSAI